MFIIIFGMGFDRSNQKLIFPKRITTTTTKVKDLWPRFEAWCPLCNLGSKESESNGLLGQDSRQRCCRRCCCCFPKIVCPPIRSFDPLQKCQPTKHVWKYVCSWLSEGLARFFCYPKKKKKTAYLEQKPKYSINPWTIFRPWCVNWFFFFFFSW